MAKKPSNLLLYQDSYNSSWLIHGVNQPPEEDRRARTATYCGVTGISQLLAWKAARWTDDAITCLECIARGSR